MGRHRFSPGMALLGLFFALTLHTQHCVNALVPGGRTNACFFTLNNTLYVFGGRRLDKTSNPFLSTPLPLVVGVTNNWIPVPLPPEGQAWGDSLDTKDAPQIDCASTKNGKVFFFGGPAGFASLNLVTNQWSTASPTFGSANADISNLKNQTVVRAATHPDGTTISIVTATAYLRYNSISNTIDGMRHKTDDGFHGLCLTVVPDLDLAVACGGSSPQRYLDGCTSFSLSGPTTYGSPMPWAQDGCLLLPYKGGMFLVSGFLSIYHSNNAPRDDSPNPPIHFLSGNSSQPWVNITNLNTGMLTVRAYAQGFTVPGTSTAVIYRGAGPWETFHDDFHIVDLTKQTWLSRVDPIPGAFISQSLSPTTMTSTKSGTLTVTPTGTSTPSDNNNHTPAIIGGTVGAVVVVALTAGLAFFIIRRGKRAPAPNPEESIQLAQNLHGSSSQSQTNSTIVPTTDLYYLPQPSPWMDNDQSKWTMEPNSPPVQYAPVGESPGRRINTVQDTSGSLMFRSSSPPRNPQLTSDPRNSYL